MRLRDFAPGAQGAQGARGAPEPLDDRERAFYGPRSGDWLLLGLMVVILLGNGAYIWHQTGAGSHVGRAAFFGLLLLCLLWAALVYTFKLSVCVRVGPHGVSVVRGPWRTELPWREVARLTERTQLLQGQRYRWLVALARDGRKMQIRDDMVDDYARFRVEIYERYRLWRDHGGTWGTTGGGPYTAKEALSGQTFWAAASAVTLALPAIYFLVLLPETDPVGWLLLVLAAVCALASGRGLLRRTTYTVDAKAIEARQKLSTLKLAWRDVAKVERTRIAFGGVILAGIRIGRFVLKLVTRTDKRVQTFEWVPRVPEYLTLRGVGHQVRVRLHRLERPDELLAWVEFYDRVGRRLAESGPQRKTGGPTRRLTSGPLQAPDMGMPGPPDMSTASGQYSPDGHPLGGWPVQAPPDLSGTSGPLDPWGAGRGGEPERAEQAAGEDSWLRGASPIQQPTTPAMGQPPLTTAPPLSPFTAPSPRDSRDQSLAGLDIFARPPEHEDIPSAYAAPQEYAPPPAPQDVPPARAGHSGPIRKSNTYGAAPHPQPPLQYQPPHVPDPREWQAPRAVESWQPEEAMGQWPPERPSHEQSAFEDGWPDDEFEPEPTQDTPFDASEELADSFAPWRDDASWQPPQLPRFGPPARDDSER